MKGSKDSLSLWESEEDGKTDLLRDSGDNISIFTLRIILGIRRFILRTSAYCFRVTELCQDVVE